MQCKIHLEVVAEVLRHLSRNVKDSLVASHGLSLTTGGFSQELFRLNGDERWPQLCWKARRAYYSFFDGKRGTHLHHPVRVSTHVGDTPAVVHNLEFCRGTVVGTSMGNADSATYVLL